VAVPAGTRGTILDARHDVPPDMEVQRVSSHPVQPVGALSKLGPEGVALLTRLQANDSASLASRFIEVGTSVQAM
jgi:hypothetical protein